MHNPISPINIISEVTATTKFIWRTQFYFSVENVNSRWKVLNYEGLLKYIKYCKIFCTVCFFFIELKVFVHLTHLKLLQIAQTYRKFFVWLVHLYLNNGIYLFWQNYEKGLKNISYAILSVFL